MAYLQEDVWSDYLRKKREREEREAGEPERPSWWDQSRSLPLMLPQAPEQPAIPLPATPMPGSMTVPSGGQLSLDRGQVMDMLAGIRRNGAGQPAQPGPPEGLLSLPSSEQEPLSREKVLDVLAGIRAKASQARALPEGWTAETPLPMPEPEEVYSGLRNVPRGDLQRDIVEAERQRELAESNKQFNELERQWELSRERDWVERQKQQDADKRSLLAGIRGEYIAPSPVSALTYAPDTLETLGKYTESYLDAIVRPSLEMAVAAKETRPDIPTLIGAPPTPIGPPPAPGAPVAPGAPLAPAWPPQVEPGISAWDAARKPFISALGEQLRDVVAPEGLIQPEGLRPELWPQAWQQKGEAWHQRPEAFPGEKGALEAIFDPLNLIGLPGGAKALTALRVAARDLAPVVRGTARAADKFITAPRTQAALGRLLPAASIDDVINWPEMAAWKPAIEDATARWLRNVPAGEAIATGVKPEVAEQELWELYGLLKRPEVSASRKAEAAKAIGMLRAAEMREQSTLYPAIHGKPWMDQPSVPGTAVPSIGPVLKDPIGELTYPLAGERQRLRQRRDTVAAKIRQREDTAGLGRSDIEGSWRLYDIDKNYAGWVNEKVRLDRMLGEEAVPYEKAAPSLAAGAEPAGSVFDQWMSRLAKVTTPEEFKAFDAKVGGIYDAFLREEVTNLQVDAFFAAVNAKERELASRGAAGITPEGLAVKAIEPTTGPSSLELGNRIRALKKQIEQLAEDTPNLRDFPSRKPTGELVDLEGFERAVQEHEAKIQALYDEIKPLEAQRAGIIKARLAGEKAVAAPSAVPEPGTGGTIAAEPSAATLQERYEQARALEAQRTGIVKAAPKPLPAQGKLPPMTDNYLKSLNTYTPLLYHETSASAARWLVPSQSNIGNSLVGDMFFANTPDLALGQRKNRGVLLEFDSRGIEGQVNTSKPAWEFMYAEGNAEFISRHSTEGTLRQNLRSITVDRSIVDPGEYRVRLQPVLRHLEEQGWNRTDLPDGRIQWTRPPGGAVEELPVAPAAEVPIPLAGELAKGIEPVPAAAAPEGGARQLWQIPREQYLANDMRGFRYRRALADVEMAVKRLGRERIEKAGWLKPGESIEEWLDRERAGTVKWQGNRKTGMTAIEEWSQKPFVFSDAAEEQRLRKAVLAYVRGDKASWLERGEDFTSLGILTPVKHEQAVRQALSEGKPVPAEVLADYPDLAAKARPARALPTEEAMPLATEEVPAAALPRGPQAGMFAATEPAMRPQIPSRARPGEVETTADLLGGAQFENEAAKVAWAREQKIRAGQQEMFGQPTTAPPSPEVGNALANIETQVPGTTLGDVQATVRNDVDSFPVSEINLDPARFQYKVVQGEGGATGSLRGVERWDPDLAQGAQLWRDPATGNVFAVNAHNRTMLARRLGIESLPNPYFIPADTAEEARTVGALANIASGRGTAVDAAKFFRDSNLTPDDLRALGLPFREKLVTDGAALANLNEGLFGAVARGEFPIERAVVIGQRLTDPDLQTKLVSMLDKEARRGRKITNDVVAELADMVATSPTERTSQMGLFGEEVFTNSLAVERAEVLAAIKSQLIQDKRLFGIVARNAPELGRAGNIIEVEASRGISTEAAQLLELFDRVKNRVGEVSDIVNDAARQLASGETAANVKGATYERIREALPRAVRGTEEGGGEGIQALQDMAGVARPATAKATAGAPQPVAPEVAPAPGPPAELAPAPGSVSPLPQGPQAALETPITGKVPAPAIVPSALPGLTAKQDTIVGKLRDLLAQGKISDYRVYMDKAGNAYLERVPTKGKPTYSKIAKTGEVTVAGKPRAGWQVIEDSEMAARQVAPAIAPEGLPPSAGQRAPRKPIWEGVVPAQPPAPPRGPPPAPPRTPPPGGWESSGRPVGGPQNIKMPPAGEPLSKLDEGMRQQYPSIPTRLRTGATYVDAFDWLMRQTYYRNYTFRRLENTGIPVRDMAQLVNGAAAAGQDTVARQLRPLWRGVGKDIEDLKKYLILESYADGLARFGPEHRGPYGMQGWSDYLREREIIKERVGDARFAKLEVTGKQLGELGDQYILQKFEQEGMVSPATRLQMKTANPHYIPFYRDIVDIDPLLDRRGAQAHLGTTGLEKRREELGSTLPTKDPLSAIEAKFIDAEVRITRNQAARAVGLALTEQQKGLLEKAGLIDSLYLPQDQQIARMLRPGQKARAEFDVLEWFDDGALQRLEVQKDIAKVAKGLENDSSHWLITMFAWMARPFRAGVITYNPAWTPVNTLYNLATGYFQEGLHPFMKEYWQGWAAALTKNTDFSEAAQARILLGGLTEQTARMTPAKAASEIIELRVRNPLDALALLPKAIRFLNQATEQSSRIAAYKLLQKGVKESTAPEAQALAKKLHVPSLAEVERRVRARNAIIDFSKSGYAIQTLSQAIPFMNPPIQQTGNILRLISKDPKAAMIRAAPFVTASVMVYLWNQRFDKEVRNKISLEAKTRYWTFIYGEYQEPPDPRYPNKPGSRRPLVLYIPKTPVGTVLTTPAEIAMMMADDQNDYTPQELGFWAWRSYMQSMAPTELSAAGLTPPALGTAWQLQSGRDEFRGRDIIPMRLQGQPPEMQYDESTTATAIALGQKTGISPMLIDFAIKDYLGGAGQTSMWLNDLALRAIGYDPQATGSAFRRARTAAEEISATPVLGRFLRTPNAGDDRAWEQFRKAVADSQRILLANPEAQRLGVTVGAIGDTMSRGGGSMVLEPQERALLQSVSTKVGVAVMARLVTEQAYVDAPNAVKVEILRNALEEARAMTKASYLERMPREDVLRRLVESSPVPLPP